MHKTGDISKLQKYDAVYGQIFVKDSWYNFVSGGAPNTENVLSLGISAKKSYLLSLGHPSIRQGEVVKRGKFEEIGFYFPSNHLGIGIFPAETQTNHGGIGIQATPDELFKFYTDLNEVIRESGHISLNFYKKSL